MLLNTTEENEKLAKTTRAELDCKYPKDATMKISGEWEE